MSFWDTQVLLIEIFKIIAPKSYILKSGTLVWDIQLKSQSFNLSPLNKMNIDFWERSIFQKKNRIFLFLISVWFLFKAEVKIIFCYSINYVLDDLCFDLIRAVIIPHFTSNFLKINMRFHTSFTFKKWNVKTTFY